ncbi:MAG: hypothetical protein KIC54_08110 [Clostridium sp.]|nr:hypothetical protein [Clostridium sp.]
MEIDIQNDLNNKNLELGKEQKSFLETTLGGIINTGLNLGIKYLLPDFVEDEVIKIKDTILNEGFKEGLNTAIDEVIDFGKSAIGIVTGKFDDISQMQKAVENGGIIDTISKGIDTGINKVNEKGKLNDTISNVIKKGKNLILDNISSNIEEMIVEQGNEINKFETSINEWKKAYENKDFDLMEKEMKNINKYLEKIMPLENIIKEARIVENIHSLIKNNNKNFEINEVELEAANVLS